MRSSSNTSFTSSVSPFTVTDSTESAMRSRNVLSPAWAPKRIVEVETKVFGPCVKSRSTVYSIG